MSDETYYISLWLLLGIGGGLLLKWRNRTKHNSLMTGIVLGILLGPFTFIITFLTPKKSTGPGIFEEKDKYESRLKFLKLKEEYQRYKLEEELKKNKEIESENFQ